MATQHTPKQIGAILDTVKIAVSWLGKIRVRHTLWV
jgi:hypothetical protein